MKLPNVLKAEWPGDFQCPKCNENLNWDEDHLYPNSFAFVQCQSCLHTFYVKQILKPSYEIK
jgi:transcription elongation factor Elf1